MNRPEVWTYPQLLRQDLGRAVVWATASAREPAASLPWPLATALDPLPPGTETLVAIGGGSLIDEAKAFRAQRAPSVRLVAVPSRWGSGAEASPVTVLDRAGRKEIHLDPSWLPDVRVLWPELGSRLPPELARDGCADALAHGVEGFLSPLAQEPLRQEIAPLIERMIATPPDDAAWFELSASACAAQARSSVGVVHGIAHTIEGELRRSQPRFGHARLCAAFLWPVLRFDRTSFGKVDDLLRRHGIDPDALERAAQRLFPPADYSTALPVLQARWRDVLRDPCTRTNSALVRPASVEFFSAFLAAGVAP
jgi:alcohol dehydrogenase class IV